MGGILASLMPGNGEAQGLLALMLLTDARRAARQTSTQEPILLADQDRTLWDGAKIADGLRLLGSALDANSVGQYALQALIAAVHTRSAASGETDWRQIAALYQALYQIAPSPVVLLNQAVAVAMAEGPERGLALIDTTQVAGVLEGYRWMHSARADLLRRSGRTAEAAEEYERAIALSENAAELAYLGRRLDDLNVP